MRKRTTLTLLGAVLAAVLVVAATTGCGSKKKSASGGTIVFCSDTTYPPMESLVGGKAVGADVDIANAIAKLMGKKAQIQTTGFDVIIPALLAKKCDAIISAMTDTPERAKQVDFADYVTVGMLLMVKKGNPSNISDLASLSGKAVAVEAATTEKAALDEQNKTFVKRGQAQITIKIFPKDTNAAIALLSGRVDAYFADATPVLYYMKKNLGFEVAGKQLGAAPEGIATRKGDPLGPKFKDAIDKLYTNGEMQNILAKWGISQFALAK